MVMAVSAIDNSHNDDDDDGWFQFEKTSLAMLHTDEVTALAFLPAFHHSNTSCPILAIGSVDGKVYVYPHALDERRDFSLQ
mmetsp:Transcript_14090/g.19664  ORF Transcript_14090/g.19664 Transcript_14090/m.19664 type:complete len:81 (-) Transcript_14090:752-994(-)